MKIVLNLVFAVFAIFLGIHETKVKAADDKGDKIMRSENELIVTLHKKVEEEGKKCKQTIKISFVAGATSKDNIDIECQDDDIEGRSRGNEYFLGKFLFSDEPNSVYVVISSGLCHHYVNAVRHINYHVDLAKVLNKEECEEIKRKLQKGKSEKVVTDGVVEAVKKVQNINPCSVSTSSSSSSAGKQI